MKAQEIRKQFIDFFKDRGHSEHPSSSLIPHNDPTLLFANAGMNQFKEFFTGSETPETKRAVTIQKCVRAGGKHNDLENVGKTARHHTFFEMLGNFSFGDYFKEDAIAYAWDFLTKELKIDKEKLYVTVHETDEEARQIWHTKQGVPLDRIFYRGDKDNFWEMGDIGPCGPCSEIFFDHGPEHSDGADTSDCILDDEGRYVEVWNLVFMQYEKFKENGEIKRRELPAPSVDTGAGLERLIACLQGKYWNYDTDVFAPIIKKIEAISGKKYDDEKYTTAMRVLCDHIRSSVFLITDGVIPSNEGRGYVLRRIIRRAIRFLDQLEVTNNCFHEFIPEVFETLGEQYPQNKENIELADKLIRLEEEKFRKTLKVGLDLIQKEIKKTKGKIFSGQTAFKLYDTYGFPVDLTQIILDDTGLELDQEGFNQEMEKQKQLSKDSANFSADDELKNLFYQVKQEVGEVAFKGYDTSTLETKIEKIIEHNEYFYVVTKQTPFYPEGGGQVGDQGTINDLLVIDTQKPIEDFIVHILKDVSSLKEGQNVTLSINQQLREKTKRNHTATHLLQAALIKTLGNHVKQAGSKVTPDYLRFDFTHTEALKKDELVQIENIVNQKIEDALCAQAELMTKDEADQKGAMALFGEKYGDEVRVLTIDDFSVELCGGTHVNNTSEIGTFLIRSEASLASGVRRIEALTSLGAIDYLKSRSQTLEKVEKAFNAKNDTLLLKTTELQANLKEQHKTILALQDKIQSYQSEDLFSNITKLSNGVELCIVDYKDGNPKDFRNLSDKFVDKNPEAVLLLFAKDNDKVSILLRTNKKNSNIRCNNIFKEAIALCNGRGGGRPDMAQGSGEHTSFEEFKNFVIQKLEEI